MIRPDELSVGDRVGHPSWGETSYECVRVDPHRFWLVIGGSTIDFAFSNKMFYVAEKLVKEKRVSGFGKWVKKNGI